MWAKMNRRLLHIIPSLSVGGAERQLVQMLACGKSASDDVRVLTLFGVGALAEDLKKNGVSIRSLEINRPLKFFSTTLPTFYGHFKWRPNIVQGWMFYANLVAALFWFLRLEKPKLIWGIRTVYVRKSFSLWSSIAVYINKIFSFLPDRIVYNSVEGKRSFEQYGFKQSGIVIPNSFRGSLWAFDQDGRERLRSKWKINEDYLVFGTVGRFDPAKGHIVLLKAIKIILQRNKSASQYMFVFTGRNVGPGNPTFADYFKDERLRRAYRHLGEQSDMAAAYSAFDAVILPSLREGFSNVLAESMLMERPCVATDVGDNTHILPQDCGTIVPPGNANALAQGIEALALYSNEQRAEMGARARQHIISHFGERSAYQKYQDLYDAL